MCRVGQKTVFLRIFPIYSTFLVKFTTLQTGSPKKKTFRLVNAFILISFIILDCSEMNVFLGDPVCNVVNLTKNVLYMGKMRKNTVFALLYTLHMVEMKIFLN